MIIMSKFAETLLSLMNERGLNAPALGELLDTDRTNITRYLRGERLPLFKGFVAMLTFFNISADVLLGRQDYSTTTTFLPIPPFGATLRKVMQETNTTQYKIVKELHISGSTLYNWLTNNSLPTIENLDKLADYMDVSIDYLLGRTDNPKMNK